MLLYAVKAALNPSHVKTVGAAQAKSIYEWTPCCKPAHLEYYSSFYMIWSMIHCIQNNTHTQKKTKKDPDVWGDEHWDCSSMTANLDSLDYSMVVISISQVRAMWKSKKDQSGTYSLLYFGINHLFHHSAFEILKQVLNFSPCIARGDERLSRGSADELASVIWC